jgi:hypothetical protein
VRPRRGRRRRGSCCPEGAVSEPGFVVPDVAPSASKGAAQRGPALPASLTRTSASHKWGQEANAARLTQG